MTLQNLNSSIAEEEDERQDKRRKKVADFAGSILITPYPGWR